MNEMHVTETCPHCGGIHQASPCPAKARSTLAAPAGSSPQHLPLMTTLQCMIAGWKGAAAFQRSLGNNEVAKALDECANTLAEEIRR